VLARFERRPRQLEVRVRRGDDVDHVDVRPAHDSLPVIGCLRYAKLVREVTRAFPLDVTEGDDLAARVT